MENEHLLSQSALPASHMKGKNTSVPKENLLYDIKSALCALPLDFRKKVQKECRWGISKFFRKVKADHTAPKDKFSWLSNAERDMILTIAYDLYEQLGELIEFHIERYSHDKK